MKFKNKVLWLTLAIIFVFVLSSTGKGFVALAKVNNTRAKSNVTFVDVVVTFNENVDFKAKFPDAKILHQYSIINGVAASIPEALYQKLSSYPFIKSVELDHTYQLSQDTLDWGVDKINAEKVWGGAENAVDVVAGSYAGQGVKVAIIDTGIQYTHPDLDANYYGGYDFVNNDNDPMDDNGHGTHVSGIVAAEDDGAGVIGVAPYAQLYGVKVLNSQGSGTYSDIVAGIDWATNNGMDVISMSLGGSVGDTALQQAMQNAYNAGIVIVAASGNDGLRSISYPAKYSTAIAVGATDSNDNLASFSNYGPEQEVVAPGVSIYSTYLGSTYQTLSGTSMATPMVTGTVALMLSKNPNLTPDQVRQYLRDSALDLGAAGWDETYGYGRVQADQAVALVPSGTPGDTTPPAQVTGLTVTTVSSSQLDLSWNPVPDADLDHYNIYRDGVFIGTSVTTSYSDTGLSPSTTYTYEVSAVDTSGNEGQKSSPVSGTTSPSAGGDTLHVFSIDMWYDTKTWWFFKWYDVYIMVTVHDGNGNPVSGVTVYLTLTLPDGSTVSGSADTGADGTVTFWYSSDFFESGWYTATVTDLVKTGFTYAPADNIETSDSIYVS